jgi:hypothetical protein
MHAAASQARIHVHSYTPPPFATRLSATMPDRGTQTDECKDVIARMNKEFDTVQTRCEAAEALVTKFKALPTDVATELVTNKFLGHDNYASVCTNEWKALLFERLHEMCGLDKYRKRKRDDSDSD